MNTDQIALQLYTVREEAKRDMIATLRDVAGMGYRAVEFAGYGNATVPMVAAALTELGLAAPSAHVGFQLLQTRAAEVFAELRALGCTYAVVPSAPEEYRADAGAVGRLGAILNDLGTQARAAGLQLGYHNHDV